MTPSRTYPDVQATVSPLAPPCPALSYAFPEVLAARLGRDYGWSQPFTSGALEEYRRFLHLAVTSQTPVTPSQVVDKVWHLHLTFTRDYWERLTPALGRPVHHDPGGADADDDAHFAAQYIGTLDAYRATFGPPPALYWPDPRLRNQPVFIQATPPSEPALAARSQWQSGNVLGSTLVVIGVAALLLHWTPLALLMGTLLLLLVVRSLTRRDRRGYGRYQGHTSLSFAGHGDSSCGPFDSGSCGDSGSSSCGGGGCSS
ncbi:hypothetical protein GCM10008955_04320 [Deinococcus malanensis]|uniref:TIGR04222 domain-containing membrane protein n=1 Tax=Deinococcus malanensis TaxID=1706855 RepID=A0ABQ2EJK1_9DEIO|nr:hypothetical protein [Deinococcus malanensis]GGK14135.1 hypothetical protein GCM10008955_04320 [Deinococcus malanensis]